MSEEPADLEYISQVLLGRTDAFEPLVRKYQSGLRIFCSRMLGDIELANDASQEAFVKAYRSLRSFRGDSSFKSWLFRIARNQCLDLLRGSRLESVESLNEDSGDYANKLRIDGSSTLHNRVESRDLLTKVFANLSIEYKEIVLMRELGGLSYDELSQVFECSQDAVKGRLKRARIELIKVFKNLESEEPQAQERERL